ncbi:hypothetical protein JVU11DRAFT_1819 [Chiua virens]|nr:hypothetical protein JVU11DRAFT_1819 [Chiua virens]
MASDEDMEAHSEDEAASPDEAELFGMAIDQIEDEDSEDDMEGLYVRSQSMKPPKCLPKAMGKSMASAQLESDPDDPATCKFEIQCQCAVQRGQGKVSLAPFQISSSVTLDKLRRIVAQKLHRFPGLVQLQYRLDSDKAKAAFTSLQSDEELKLFMQRMRLLIVPQRLPSGRVSTRALKNVQIIFEDASTENNDGPIDTSDRNSAKLGTKASGSRSSSKQKPSTEEIQGFAEQEEVVKLLEERWRCDAHSKASKMPVYCYHHNESNVCYPLTQSNLAYWAFEVMDKRTTVDEKPDAIRTHQARPRTRNMNSDSSVTDPDQTVQHAATAHIACGHPSMHAATQPVINVFPPWNVPSSQPVTYTPLPQLTNLSPPAPSTLPYRTPSPQPTNTPTGSSNASIFRSESNPADVMSNTKSIDPMLSLPGIASWFKFTAKRMKKSPPGVDWVELGLKLESEGFIDISQISTNWIEVPKLQQLLGIQLGTAIFIFQRVECDIQAIQAGRLIIPDEL